MNPRSASSKQAGRLRVCLFTDTLGDINGVSRFVRTIAEQSLAEPKSIELHVLTSTRFTCPDAPNVHNFSPRLAGPMPGYATLDIVIPPTRALWQAAERLRPQVVHLSTPGPVGSVGRSWARRKGVPLVATYHTDFPAYVEQLFDDRVLTWASQRWMKRFYVPCQAVFSRSAEYAAALERLGLNRNRIVQLKPGIDTGAFHTQFREASNARRAEFWSGFGCKPETAKVLYCGRVSVEKNLPQLAAIWPRVARMLDQRGGAKAELVVVGDGPYRGTMQRELAGQAVFLGFRHGDELSRLYANSDVFVFPSTTDTLGQAVMEAQSSGLPVLVTDQGGPREVVDHDWTGFVLPAIRSETAEAWIAALLRLVQDAALRARMGSAGHLKIQGMSIRNSFMHFSEVHERVAAAQMQRG